MILPNTSKRSEAWGTGLIKSDAMDEIKRLRTFLITRFLQIAAILTIAEVGVVWLINRTLLAGALKYALGTNDLSSLGVKRVSLLVLVLLGELLRSVVIRMFSKSVTIPLGFLSRFIQNPLSEHGLTDPLLASINDLSGFKRSVLWFVLLAAVVLVLLPFAAGAILYSRVVIREFAIIEEREKEKNREYERKRNLMLSDIAHDLRTPMTTISGYARALEDDLITEDRRHEIYAAIQAKSVRMNDLIGLLFDYAKLDSEGFELNREQVDICEMVRECTAFMYQDIEDAGLEPEIDIPEEAVLKGLDRVQFSRVISNLISNAIKHNEHASRIGVYVTVLRDNMVLVMVCDDGEPIEEQYADHIFEPFVTADESRNSKGGSGLGLSIAKKIVDMHGGAIRLYQGEKMALLPSGGNLDVLHTYTKAFIIQI